jgi:hypothetical protein
MLEIPAWAIGVGIIIIAGSIGGALKRLISGETGMPRHRGKASRRELGELAGELGNRLGEIEALRSRLAELEDVQRRLGELEERVDFAERLLAKQRDADRLAPPRP